MTVLSVYHADSRHGRELAHCLSYQPDMYIIHVVKQCANFENCLRNTFNKNKKLLMYKHKQVT